MPAIRSPTKTSSTCASCPGGRHPGERARLGRKWRYEPTRRNVERPRRRRPRWRTDTDIAAADRDGIVRRRPGATDRSRPCRRRLTEPDRGARQAPQSGRSTGRRESLIRTIAALEEQRLRRCPWEAGSQSQLTRPHAARCGVTETRARSPRRAASGTRSRPTPEDSGGSEAVAGEPRGGTPRPERGLWWEVGTNRQRPARHRLGGHAPRRAVG